MAHVVSSSQSSAVFVEVGVVDGEAGSSECLEDEEALGDAAACCGDGAGRPARRRAAGRKPAPTAAPEPLDEPPGVRFGSKGLVVGPEKPMAPAPMPAAAPAPAAAAPAAATTEQKAS